VLIKSSTYIGDLNEVSLFSFPWERMRGKSVLITGACGLICSCIVDIIMYRNVHFDDNITVYALCRNGKAAKRRFLSYFESGQFVFVKQDVCDKIGLESHIDYIIHGASHAHPAAFANDPVGTMMTNFHGMYNSLRFARENASTRVLFVSSSESYGEITGQMGAVSEDYSGYVNPMDVRSCYPSSKRAAETLCVSFASQYNVDVVVARPSHVYGPSMRSSDSRAISAFIRNVLSENDVIMKSQGTQVRGYCYVVDAASAILSVMLMGESCNAYNVSDKDSILSVKEMADIVAKCGNRNLVISEASVLEKAGFTPVSWQVLDSSKLENLGWKAKTHIKEGISKTLKIMKEASLYK